MGRQTSFHRLFLLAALQVLTFGGDFKARGEGAATAEAGWEIISEEDGTVVWQKPAGETGIISIRGEATIDASLADVFDTMRDNSTAADWMPLIAERRDLKALTDHSRLEYTHLAMPWPVTDRYFINEAASEPLQDGALHLYVRSVEDAPKEYLEADKILGFLHKSDFLLVPVDGGTRTNIKLEVNSDPKGMIPKLLVNYAQKNWPIEFFTGLTAQLRKRGRLGAKPPAIAH